MKPEIVKSLTSEFEGYTYDLDGIDCWFARDLQKLLKYSEWRNFLKVIGKAKISCEKTGHIIIDHFVDVNNMVETGSGAQREVDGMQRNIGFELMEEKYSLWRVSEK